VASKKPSATVATYFAIAAQADHPPVVNPDSFQMGEDDAFNAASNTLVLGNLLVNDTDPDGDTLKLVSIQNMSVDVTQAGASFAGMTATLDNGTVSSGNPAIVTLHLNGQTATVQIADDGTATVSDSNHLFNALATGQEIVLHASDTFSDGSLTSSTNLSITINGVGS
jgi:hypothetical protein